MAKHLVIVESPTKAKTIEKFLGKDYEVRASFGHIRDLPNSASEIPATLKKQAWTRLGINVEQDFEPLYIIPSEKQKHVKELQSLLKNAEHLYLATDEDREGESISWHLLEVLKPKIPCSRLVFHEITKEAIQQSLANTRDIAMDLVRAQETRRIVDRLYGYSVSPLLWKKMAPRLSAGRVQSVAMRLLVQRERERIKFRSSEYWDLKALFKTAISESVEAELATVASKRVASGKDFVQETGLLDSKSNAIHLKQADAEALLSRLTGKLAKVLSIEEKPYSTRPSPPFTTSTLQQDAVRKLGYAARRTMQVAQRLYENGFITYMRTDSTSLSNEAISAARNFIKADYGESFVPAEPRIYRTKVKNAQEAHEAIRPAGAAFQSISEVRAKLGEESARLYELIWKRTVASQMKDAHGKRTSVEIGCEDCTFRTSGSTIEFAGFLRAYVEGSDDPDADLADRERILPKLSLGQELSFEKLEALKHETQAPARFTEGSLIKELERLGIGRPSTWATIVDLVLSRTYAFKKGQALVPTFLAVALTSLMENYFKDMVDYDNTAKLEDDLDAISRGEATSHDYLNKFYNGNGHPGLSNLVSSGEANIDPRIVCGISLGQDGAGNNVEVRIGKFGPFLSNGTDRAGLPDELCPDELTIERAQEILKESAAGPQSLGVDPKTSLPVFAKKGRFGPYVQLGEQVEGGDKPKMVSLLKNMKPEELDLETALKLLELPRNIGIKPDTTDDIIATLGRFGPYLKCGTDSRSLPDDISVLDVSLEQALQLFAEPRMRRGQSKPKSLKELGLYPPSGKNISVKSGRYGPYVTDGDLNASIPKDMSEETITLENAIELLTKRAEYIQANGVGKKSRTKKAPAKSKAATKKAAPKTKAKPNPSADAKKKKTTSRKKAAASADSAAVIN
jgi:DNA topoisomerase-1